MADGGSDSGADPGPPGGRPPWTSPGAGQPAGPTPEPTGRSPEPGWPAGYDPYGQPSSGLPSGQPPYPPPGAPPPAKKRRLGWLIAGIAAAGLVLAAAVATGLALADRKEGRAVAFDRLRVGDCLIAESESVEELEDARFLACEKPHDEEVFAVVVLPDGDWPGEEKLEQDAGTACEARFEDFVGVAYDDSSLDFNVYYPLEDAWADGDREVICVVYDPRGPVSGSRRDSRT